MQRTDILIAGGGIVGTCLALALRRSLRGALGVTLVERPAPVQDDRAFAISAGSRHMFEALGVWDTIADDAQPIKAMEISDSRLNDPVRPVFLTFVDPSRGDEPFAHMVPEQTIIMALRNAADAAGVVFTPGKVRSSQTDGGGVTTALQGGGTIRASLLVACDGARSSLREEAGIGWATWGYRQSGVVATIGHERDHEGRACEHFLPSGPFAILPLTGRRFSMVWTEETERAKSLLTRSDDEILFEIEKRAGLSLGPLTLLSRPRAYPLIFGLARRFNADRLVLAGDAAHVVHPIAGQGLNLGLRDVAALAELIVDAASLGLDPGGSDVTLAYEKVRRNDTVAMAVTTDGLNRLFSNDALPLRLARDLGLGLVDRAPSLKRFLMREAAAENPKLPLLMRGIGLPGF